MPDTARSMLRAEYRCDDYRYDPWGTALAHHFAVCDVLDVIAPDDIPAEWQFCHGAFGAAETLAELADGDSYPTAELAMLAEDHDVTARDLVRWGNVLARMTRVARLAGKDY